MPTAVIISGQVRTFSTCLPSLRHHVFNRLDDPHFFCSVADENQASDIHLLEAYYPGKVFVERVTQPELSLPGDTKPASSNLGESQRHRLAVFAPYAISSPIQSILRAAWAMNRAWEFFDFECKSHPAETPTGDWLGMFDTIVRCRTDLWFHAFAGSSFTLAPDAAHLPWWSRCGGVNDRFGIMGMEAARHYFTHYAKIGAMLESGCPLHPESLLAESLRLGGVAVHNTLLATFSTVRQSGERQKPLEYPGELAALIASR